MTSRTISTTGNRRRSLPLACAALWIALLTALFSSLMPGGLPRTTVLGSAFNPATIAVALKPSRTLPRITADAADRDATADAGELRLPVAAPPAVLPAIPAGIAVPPVVVVTEQYSLPARILPGAGPRAPPLT